MSTETQRAELPPLVGILAKQPDHVRQSIEAYGAACARVAQASQAAEIEALREDAARWRYAVAIGENQSMNWLDVYDDWNGEGEFTAAIDAAMQTKEAS